MGIVIFIDSAEPIEIKQKLQEKNREIIIQTLPVGDYYLTGEYGEILLTRKTYADLARSIGDASVWTELGRMSDSQIEKKALILEGDINVLFQFKEFSFASVAGTIMSIALDWSFPIIPTKDIAHTVYCISQLNERLGRDKVLKHWKIRHLPRVDESERPRYLVEGLPSVGGKKSVALLEKFKTPLDVFLAEKADLQEVEGIGKKMAQGIYDAVRQTYTPKKRGKKPKEAENAPQ